MLANIFPAYAGLNLGNRVYCYRRFHIPRIRGVEPYIDATAAYTPEYSPHTRG